MSPTESYPPRRLKDQDVARVVSAARRLGYPIGTLVEMMVLTAAPPRATRFMRWADIDRDHWMTAAEAIEYGLVSRVIERQTELG